MAAAAWYATDGGAGVRVGRADTTIAMVNQVLSDAEVNSYGEQIRADAFNLAANKITRYLGGRLLSAPLAIEGALDYLSSILAAKTFDFERRYKEHTTITLPRTVAVSYPATPVPAERYHSVRVVSGSPTPPDSPSVGETSAELSIEDKAKIFSGTISLGFISKAMSSSEVAIPSHGVNYFTVLLQRALKLMESNNKEEEGRFTYHWEGHAAEMLIDVARKLAAKAKTWGLSDEQKKGLISLGVLCAAYHDVYFRGMRGPDEATCADIVARELGLALPSADTTTDGKRINLIRMIHVIIEGGTLPDYQGATMFALISTPRVTIPARQSASLVALLDATHTLEECDVYRTATPKLRSLTRLQMFDEATQRGLGAVKASLNILAESALTETGLAITPENMNGILDLLGQNLRMVLESKAFADAEQLTTTEINDCKPYIEGGRLLAALKNSAGVSLSLAGPVLSKKLFDRFNAEARFATVLANTYRAKHPEELVGGQCLLDAHAKFMTQLASLKDAADAQQILQYALLRAGCQDGARFKGALLNPAFNADRMLDVAIANPEIATDELLARSALTPVAEVASGGCCWSTPFGVHTGRVAPLDTASSVTTVAASGGSGAAHPLARTASALVL